MNNLSGFLARILECEAVQQLLELVQAPPKVAMAGPSHETNTLGKSGALTQS